MGEENNTHEFRALLLEKVENLNKSFGGLDTRFSDFTRGIGERVEKHGDRISILETSVAILLKVAWLIFATVASAAILTLWKLIAK